MLQASYSINIVMIGLQEEMKETTDKKTKLQVAYQKQLNEVADLQVLAAQSHTNFILLPNVDQIFFCHDAIPSATWHKGVLNHKRLYS